MKKENENSSFYFLSKNSIKLIKLFIIKLKNII